MTGPDDLRNAIQRLLNEAGDGWSVHQFVVSMGLERFTSDGQVESIPWFWAPPDQPEWQTVALLGQAVEMLQTADEESED